MANVVLNPQVDAVKKELQIVINKWHDYLKEVSVDYKVIRDDYSEIAALAPVIKLVFKDTSEYVYELTTGEKAHAATH